MSTIGSPSAAGLGLASSIVGSSRPEAATDRSKAASAEQKARVDQKDLLAKTLDDVADPEFGSDRDADGRLLYRRSGQPARSGKGDDASSQAPAAPRPADAFGDSGNALDIEA
jgi:hypothetical protein